MHAHHASTLQIRLSWTFFGLPWVLLSRLGGWLADHANRRIVALLGLLNGAFFLALYPHIHSNDVILGLGSLESVGTALSLPSISSLMSQGAATASSRDAKAFSPCQILRPSPPRRACRGLPLHHQRGTALYRHRHRVSTLCALHPLLVARRARQ